MRLYFSFRIRVLLSFFDVSNTVESMEFALFSFKFLDLNTVSYNLLFSRPHIGGTGIDRLEAFSIEEPTEFNIGGDPTERNQAEKQR